MKHACLTFQNNSTSLTQETPFQNHSTYNNDIITIRKHHHHHNETSRSSSLNKLESNQIKTFTRQRRLMVKFKTILIAFLFLTFIIDLHFIVFFHIQFEHDQNGINNERNVNLTLNELVNEKLSFMKQQQEQETTPIEKIQDIPLCLANKEWLRLFVEHIWIYIDMSLIYVIPFLTMTLSFLFICFKIKETNESYAEFQIDDGHKLNRDIYERKINRNKRVILKLFLINFYYIVTIMPYFIFELNLKRKYGFLKEFVMCLYYSNNAVNFFLYGITCSRFRDELCKINMGFKGKKCFCRKSKKDKVF